MGEKERRGEEGKKGRKVRTEKRVEGESNAASFFVRSKQPLPKNRYGFPDILGGCSVGGYKVKVAYPEDRQLQKSKERKQSSPKYLHNLWPGGNPSHQF